MQPFFELEVITKAHECFEMVHSGKFPEFPGQVTVSQELINVLQIATDIVSHVIHTWTFGGVKRQFEIHCCPICCHQKELNLVKNEFLSL